LFADMHKYLHLALGAMLVAWLRAWQTLFLLAEEKLMSAVLTISLMSRSGVRAWKSDVLSNVDRQRLPMLERSNVASQPRTPPTWN
jgi:hypothetical protein